MISGVHSANFNDFCTHRLGPPADIASDLAPQTRTDGVPLRR